MSIRNEAAANSSPRAMPMSDPANPKRRAFADQSELQLAACDAQCAQQTQRSAPAQHGQ